MNNDIINRNCCAFENCNRKLKLIDFACKCEKIFCKIHRLPENHNCVYVVFGLYIYTAIYFCP